MTDKHPMEQLPFDNGITLLTLAMDTGIIAAASDQLQNYKAVSIRGSWALNGLTLGDGPLLFGIADGELTLIEISQYLQDIPTDRRNAPENERVQRAVQVLGTLGFRMETQWVRERIILPTFRENRGFTFWCLNVGQTMTTGAVILINGRMFGRWLD